MNGYEKVYLVLEIFLSYPFICPFTGNFIYLSTHIYNLTSIHPAIHLSDHQPSTPPTINVKTFPSIHPTTNSPIHPRTCSTIHSSNKYIYIFTSISIYPYFFHPPIPLLPHQYFRALHLRTLRCTNQLTHSAINNQPT